MIYINWLVEPRHNSVTLCATRTYSSRRLWTTLECPLGIDYRALRTITEPNEGQCHVTELALSLSANARSVINCSVMPTNHCVNAFCRNFYRLAQLIMYCRSELVINGLRAPAADDNSSPITLCSWTMNLSLDLIRIYFCFRINFVSSPPASPFYYRSRRASNMVKEADDKTLNRL